MALIKCPKCKHEISDTTKKCIHCKTKVKSNNNTLKINYKLVIPISIISLFLIISFIVYKIDDNKIHYNDKKQNIEEVKTNDENNLNNNQEDSYVFTLVNEIRKYSYIDMAIYLSGFVASYK